MFAFLPKLKARLESAQTPLRPPLKSLKRRRVNNILHDVILLETQRRWELEKQRGLTQEQELKE